MLPTAPKNFLCLGPQEYPAMQQLLADADVYLATVQENHSIQVIEALACGLPVLGYDWGGTGETLQRGQGAEEQGWDGVGGHVGGILVAPGDMDELAAALDDVIECKQELGAEGRALAAERYQWVNLVGRLAEVYEEALEMREAEEAPERIRASIIIPVYNKGPWIAETLRSALDQRGAPAYEVIVVDDGSTDDSLAAILAELGVRVTAAALAPRDVVEAPPARCGRARRVLVFARANGGVAAARNFGIEQAEGGYITCLDADDMIAPQFLARLTAALDAEPGLGIAYCDMTAFGVNENGQPWETPLDGATGEYDFEKLKRGNFIPCCNVFRKVAWARAGGYKPINPSWEDYELWLNMGKLGWHGRRVPAHLFSYRKVEQTGRDYASRGQEWRLRATVNSYHRDLYPPTVSFVIPCYEQSQFLAEAIESALAQTFPDIEVVVVDDGNAPDEAARIAQIVGQFQPEVVRLECLRANSGLAAARNAGVEAARGRWIVPLDADDRVAPTFVERCLQAVRLDPQRFAYGDSVLWWPEGDRGAGEQGSRGAREQGSKGAGGQRELPAWAQGLQGKIQLLESHEYSFDELLVRITWPCTIMVSKEAWRQAGGYKPQMSDAGGWEDWEFAVSLGEIGVCGVRVAEPLFAYRQHSAQQMRYRAEQQKPVLQEQLRRLHAAVYRGERPMGCCGRGNRTVPEAAVRQAQSTARSAQAVGSNGTEDLVLVRYAGGMMGTTTWTAPSGRTYRFGIAEPLQQVRRTDAEWFALRSDFVVV
jgi:glycosyltransferase involved in cell wall biosynthesis